MKDGFWQMMHRFLVFSASFLIATNSVDWVAIFLSSFAIFAWKPCIIASFSFNSFFRLRNAVRILEKWLWIFFSSSSNRLPLSFSSLEVLLSSSLLFSSSDNVEFIGVDCRTGEYSGVKCSFIDDFCDGWRFKDKRISCNCEGLKSEWIICDGSGCNCWGCNGWACNSEWFFDDSWLGGCALAGCCINLPKYWPYSARMNGVLSDAYSNTPYFFSMFSMYFLTSYIKFFLYNIHIVLRNFLLFNLRSGPNGMRNLPSFQSRFLECLPNTTSSQPHLWWNSYIRQNSELSHCQYYPLLSAWA